LNIKQRQHASNTAEQRTSVRQRGVNGIAAWATGKQRQALLPSLQIDFNDTNLVKVIPPYV
jgi:hypothetical protein